MKLFSFPSRIISLLLFACFATSMGCIEKVERACRTDRDCLAFAPRIHCFEGTCNTQACTPGDTKSCYDGPPGTEDKGICRKGQQTCNRQGQWTPCLGQQTPEQEICDKTDNNCDGQTDEPPSGTDKDWCKCPISGAKRQCYSGKKGTNTQGECNAGIQYCERDQLWGNCLNQQTPATEFCDGLDNDCDGTIDNGVTCPCKPGEERLCYPGNQKDIGKGPCAWGTATCQDNRTWGPCQNATLAADKETCGNKTDDNCNGLIDEECGSNCKAPTPNSCDNVCVDTQTNPAHCGACNNPCPTNEVCVGGSCQATCNPPYDTTCNDTCVDTNTDPKHCGACGQACTDKGTYCLNGTCQQCDRNLDACGTTCCTKDQTCCGGQCIQIKQHPQNCGSCGNACGTGEVCQNGTCGCKDGVTRSCYTGTNGTQQVGTCRTGIQTCSNGTWSTCNQEVTPRKETCNGFDDDCNGTIDDNIDPANAPDCPNTGPCAGKQKSCISGTWTCPPTIQKDEICDGIDNDCNGQIDDIPPDKRVDCDSQQGVCKGQKKRCIAGTLENCDAIGYQQTETQCDGLDNDCDGQTDTNCKSCFPTYVDVQASLHDRYGTRGGIYDIRHHPNGKWRAWAQSEASSGNADQQNKIIVASKTTELHRLAHGTTLLTVDFTPDGTYILGGGANKITKWSVTTGALIATWSISGTATAKRISKLRVSPSNKLIAVVVSNTIELWSLSSQKQIGTLKGHTSTITHIDFSADGSRLASASVDRTARIWDVNNQKELFSLTPHGDRVNFASFSLDGTYLVTGTGTQGNAKETNVRIWNANTGTLITTIQSSTAGNPTGHFAAIHGAIFSPDNTYLTTGAGQADYSLRIWDIRTITKPKLIRVLHGNIYSFLELSRSFEGTRFSTRSTLEVREWNCPQSCTFRNPPRFKQFANRNLTSMQLHPDNQVAYATSSTATNTGTVLIGMEQNGRNEAFSPLTLRPTNLTNPVHFGIFSYYETTGYYLAADTHIYYFGKLPTSTSKAKLSLNSAIKDAVNLPHNLSIFAVTEDKKVHEITIFGKLNTSTKLLTSIPTTIERSSNGQRIAIGMEDGTVQIRDPNTDAILHTLTARKTSAGPARIQALAFVENDEHTVLVAYDKMVDKWSTTNNTITTLTSAVHTKPIASIAVSPDGTQLATGSQDQSVEIWDLASNTSKGALLQDTQSTTKDGEILQLNWSSDGKTIVAAYTGGTFKFWYGSNCK